MNPDTAEAVNSLYREIKDKIGTRLFTILAFRADGTEMERTFSSHPAEYPVGGRKNVAADVAQDWLSACLTEQVPFFGRTQKDVERIFKDFELIRSLGCGSIINVPIVDGGTTKAALNILDAEGAYTDQEVLTAVEIAKRYKESVLDAVKE
ncbi:MAG TPA: GAF domain-containing protein [Micrococcaceae bacterium]|jgi:hypothetical protein|nr:GAF domain-containing protein [Micrococcaceae bacterium]